MTHEGSDRPPLGVAITMVRKLAAARLRVFRAWTDPRLMARWLAPGADAVITVTADLRRGGHYRLEGRHAEGTAYSISGTYLDIVEPTRIEMSWSYDGPVTALKGPRSVVVAEFAELGERLTELTITHERNRDREQAEVTRVNWTSCIDKLETVVAGDPAPEPAATAAPRDFFTAGQRDVQDKFATRDLADRLEAVLIHDHLKAADAAFITRQNMFFLATADAYGQPNCSYKGGARGFVTVIDDHCLAYPDYDGNGMHISSGNIHETSKVGLLFVDFEQQARMRVLGQAQVSDQDRLLARYPGAKMIVRVKVESVFSNCPRYVHRMKLVEESFYVPDATGDSPVPEWKQLHAVADVLPETDKSAAGTATDANKTLNRDS